MSVGVQRYQFDTTKYQTDRHRSSGYNMRVYDTKGLPTLTTYNGMNVGVARGDLPDSVKEIIDNYRSSINHFGGVNIRVYDDAKSLPILSASGERFNKSYRGAMSTKEIIDTIRIYNDTGRVRLNAVASKGRNVTRPTRHDRINVDITARDALASNLSWQWDLVDFKDNSEILLRNNGDSSFTGLVDVKIKVR